MIATYACNRCRAVYAGGTWWIVFKDVAISIAPWDNDLAKYKPGDTEHYCNACIQPIVTEWLEQHTPQTNI